MGKGIAWSPEAVSRADDEAALIGILPTGGFLFLREGEWQQT
jgi:hypothetical protein